jgi:hypothetical protein
MNTEQTVSSSAPLAWVKSSYSSEQGGNCVEVATGSRMVHVRDSKDRESGSLAFSPEAWAAFVDFAAEHMVTA